MHFLIALQLINYINNKNCTSLCEIKLLLQIIQFKNKLTFIHLLKILSGFEQKYFFYTILLNNFYTYFFCDFREESSQ